MILSAQLSRLEPGDLAIKQLGDTSGAYDEKAHEVVAVERMSTSTEQEVYNQARAE